MTKEDEGVDDGDAHLAGQVVIDKALKHDFHFGWGALKVVNLGDDADTVGAVYGGLKL